MPLVRATALLVFTLMLPAIAFQQPATNPAPSQKPPAQQDVNKSNAPVAPEKQTEPTQPNQTAPAAPATDVHPLEEKLRSIPEPARIRENMKRMSARPHHVGSPYDKDNAEWILARYKEYGWDAKIEQFDVLFPTPKERIVEMVSPKPFRLKL